MENSDQRKLLSALCHGSIFLSSLLISIGIPVAILLISEDSSRQRKRQRSDQLSHQSLPICRDCRRASSDGDWHSDRDRARHCSVCCQLCHANSGDRLCIRQPCSTLPLCLYLATRLASSKLNHSSAHLRVLLCKI